MRCARALDLANAGSNSAARMAMMAMTTSNSIRVNAARGSKLLFIPMPRATPIGRRVSPVSSLAQTQDLPCLFRELFFFRENSLPTPPFYRHLVFRGVELDGCRTLDLKFILCRRFERDSGSRARRLKEKR